MEASKQLRDFWNQASGRNFAHPLDFARFERCVARDARVLDFGCGPGRLCVDLLERGYRHLTGVDFAERMVQLAKQNAPGARFIQGDGGRLPFEDASVDAVLLFAVLTCMPSDDSQRGLLAEFKRVLRPGGLLVVSDYPLQDDARNRERYSQYAEELGTYGLFRLPGGGVLRHHRRAWLDDLMSGFALEHSAEIDVLTMNGNPARIVQLWGRRK
jgi:SAM-dependent methyltransferase